VPPGLQLIDLRSRFGDVVASLAIVIGSTALLIPLAGRIYAGAVLRTGAKVKLRDAWRAAA
jgi:ABC-2 type transport system permease protein